MTLNILNKAEKQEILRKLNEQFGITNLPGVLIKIGMEKIFLFQGSLNEQEIKALEEAVPIERAGIYFAKIQEDQIRLSIEGTQLLKDQINKNIFEIDDEQVEQWIKGNELNIATGKKGFLIMKYKDDFLGAGKASQEKITNFLPKYRRLKNKG